MELNIETLIFQLIMFFTIVAVPIAIIVFFIFKRNSEKRLRRIEEKLDKIISERNEGIEIKGN